MLFPKRHLKLVCVAAALASGYSFSPMAMAKSLPKVTTEKMVLSQSANKEIQDLVIAYKVAFENQDKEKIKSLVTEKFFKRLNTNKLLDRLFAKNKKAEGKNHQHEGGIKPGSFKVEVIQSKVVKGSIMASLAPKKSNEGHNHKEWFKIEKVKGRYLIDQEVHLD